MKQTPYIVYNAQCTYNPHHHFRYCSSGIAMCYVLDVRCINGVCLPNIMNINDKKRKLFIVVLIFIRFPRPFSIFSSPIYLKFQITALIICVWILNAHYSMKKRTIDQFSFPFLMRAIACAILVQPWVQSTIFLLEKTLCPAIVGEPLKELYLMPNRSWGQMNIKTFRLDFCFFDVMSNVTGTRLGGHFNVEYI